MSLGLFTPGLLDPVPSASGFAPDCDSGAVLYSLVVASITLFRPEADDHWSTFDGRLVFILEGPVGVSPVVTGRFRFVGLGLLGDLLPPPLGYPFEYPYSLPIICACIGALVGPLVP